jgi:lipopolysaccharide export LptBFGC system permease protein LptF
MRKLWVVPIVILAVTVLGFVVMNLWNWLIPALFAGKTITFWQALGALVLSRILFGGFSRGHGGRRFNMADRWDRLTPEEREKFRAGMLGKFDQMTPEDKEKFKARIDRWEQLTPEEREEFRFGMGRRCGGRA